MAVSRGGVLHEKTEEEKANASKDLWVQAATQVGRNLITSVLEASWRRLLKKEKNVELNQNVDEILEEIRLREINYARYLMGGFRASNNLSAMEVSKTQKEASEEIQLLRDEWVAKKKAAGVRY